MDNRQGKNSPTTTQELQTKKANKGTKAIREMYTYLFTNEREGLWILKTVYYGAAVAAAAWCIWHVSDVLWSYHRGTTILTKPKIERPISANKKSE